MAMKDFESDLGDEIRKRTELLLRMHGEIQEKLATVSGSIVDCLRAGGSVFACGNGGSAAQAQHFAAELVGRFKIDRPALPVFCLTDNSATLTSIANDYRFEEVFSRQIGGMAKSGDCLLALSTSGSSENIVRACREARKMDLQVFVLTGESGGAVAAESHVAIRVPDSQTARIQEVHLVLIHLICQMVEAAIFCSESSRTK
jgi:phosphoheptose isomerase